jgi:NAD(P)-dependent dehydrogenase (short-subunit alcohol dehydrogenase family)
VCSRCGAFSGRFLISVRSSVFSNVKSILYAIRHLVPAIKATVGDDGPTGSIVVNSSCMGVSVVGPKSAGSAVYSASKAFVNSIVETAAIENAPRIRVNAVLPGVVQTDIMPVDDATYHAIAAALQPLWGRPGKVREISSLVSFLLSDEASFISGSLIKADGLWGLSGGGM